MPGRHAVSGDASPSPQSTIKVVPRQPPRLKLKFRPKEPVSEPEETIARPKRKISRPARYLDNVCEPFTKKRRITTASTMSLQTPTSILLPSESLAEQSSDPIVLTSSKPVDKRDYADSNEVQHAGYGADFLNNFIDDTPRSSISALDSVIGSQNGHKMESDFLPESDSLPEAAELVHHTLPELNSISSAYLNKGMQSPMILSSSVSSLPQQLDSPEACIAKLQSACHALSGLNIPPVPSQRQIPTPTISLDCESEVVSFSDQSVYLPNEDTNSRGGVDALLAAAAGSDQPEDKQATEFDGSYAGEPDEDIRILITKAIEILRHHIVHVHRLAANQERSSGQGKHSRKDKWNTDAERLVVSTLEPLLYGGSTNIGCIISNERANLMWQLYSQLVHLVTAPHRALSETPGLLQHPPNGFNTQHLAVAPPRKRSLQSRKGKAAKVPVPHKFLSRQKNPT
ncbi:hypothetical protein E4T52_11757 [Aureobasidium sp. EXF-3400]|nr:hypothetical protein E4T51_05131 [Aureobasidium sp. EXF-12344]KAI4773276.1 hypothetical protein E4T52_11757 [Aureobasidium sp. EXF-3400]